MEKINIKNRIFFNNKRKIVGYEQSVFNHLNIDKKDFDKSIYVNNAWCQLLRNWISEKLIENVSAEIVANNIIKSGILEYLQLLPHSKNN